MLFQGVARTMFADTRVLFDTWRPGTKHSVLQQTLEQNKDTEQDTEQNLEHNKDTEQDPEQNTEQNKRQSPTTATARPATATASHSHSQP